MTMNLIIKIYNFILFGFFDNFLKNSIGVIHIGANSGQEKDHYTKLRVERVIWIEADPEIYEILLRNIKNYKNFKAYNYLVTDKNKKKVKFNIANNDSNSSSMFELKDSRILYPSLNYTKSILLNSKNLKTIVNEKKINLNNFDSLVLDVQGAELKILKGGGGFN
jgi:FkbM family methyltransferase